MAPPKPHRKVLIVEDDAATRELYRKVLLNEGYSVAAVEDGLDALRRVESERPDAVVLDLMLPRLGGEDVYRELRANPATQSIPVVIVTGTEVRELESSALRHFLRKPVSADALAQAVENAINTRVVR